MSQSAAAISLPAHATLKKSVREGSLAFRFGGEAFFLLMPGLGLAQALERVEGIRRKIETLGGVHDGKNWAPLRRRLDGKPVGALSDG